MAALRDILETLDTYHDRHGRYPPSRTDRVGDIRADLEPAFIARLPVTDGWGAPILYSSSGETYELRSLGSDRVHDGLMTGHFDGYRGDIVVSNGQFGRQPHGY